MCFLYCLLLYVLLYLFFFFCSESVLCALSFLPCSNERDKLQRRTSALVAVCVNLCPA